MATPAATDIEINPGPQTPKSRKMNPFHTPTNSPNTKENVSTPRRTKLFNTLKSLSVRRSNRGEVETNSPKSLGRRRSAWDLLARLSQKGSSADDQSIFVAERPRTGSVSPSKEHLCNLKLSDNNGPPMLQRRKSLGDVIGTIRKKAMTRYNTISHHRGRQPEAMTAFDDAHLPGEQLEQELRDFAPVISLHLPGASFEENVDPVTMVDQMVDDFKLGQERQLIQEAKGSESSGTIWSGSDTATLIEPCEPVSKDEYYEQSSSSSEMSEEYMRALIESHCGHSDAGVFDQQEISPCPSPEKYQAVEGIDFLEDDCSVHKAFVDGQNKVISVPNGSLEFGLTLPLEPSATSLQRDQRPVVLVREVYSDSEYSQDFDADSSRRPIEKNDEHDKLKTTSSVANEQLTQAERIRLTLAKMTKNYHSYEDNNSSFEHNEKEVWDAIVTGDKILHNETPPKKTRRISSIEDGFERHKTTNKILEESVKLRSPSEHFAFIRSSLRSPSPHDEQRCSLAATTMKKETDLLSTYEELSLHEDEDEVKFVKLGSLKRIGMKARVPLNPDRHTMGPFHLQFPQVGNSPARKYTFEYKSEVISKWYDEIVSGKYSRFCIFDPQKSKYTIQPGWAASPDLRLLKRSGLEALWLPRRRTNCDTLKQPDLGQNPWTGDDAEEITRIPNLYHNGTIPAALKDIGGNKVKSQNTNGLNHISFSSNTNGGPWPNLLPDGSRRSSYDMETSFLTKEAAQTGSADSSLMTEPSSKETEEERNDKEEFSLLDGDNSNMSLAVNTDSARSFLGSQFPHTEVPMANPAIGMPSYPNLLKAEATNDIITAPLENEKPVVVRTWFDLAKEYEASHSNALVVLSDCHDEDKNDAFSTPSCKVEDIRGLRNSSASITWPNAAKEWTAASPTEELSELDHHNVRLTWPQMAEEWTASSPKETVSHHRGHMDSGARTSSGEAEEEDIQMTVLKSRTESSSNEVFPSRYGQTRCSSLMPTVEHIENVDEENVSKFPTTRIGTGVALTNTLGKGPTQPQPKTSDYSSTMSTMSYTSYVEAEMHARKLWQTVYPHAHGQTPHDLEAEKVSAQSQTRVEDIADTLYLEVYGRGRQGAIPAGQSCNQPVPRPTSVTSFASGFRFSKSADHIEDDSKGDVGVACRTNDPLPDQRETSGATCFLETEGTSQSATNDSTEYEKSARAQVVETTVENAQVNDGLVRQTKRSIGALVDIFQAHGLMSNLKSPFTRSSSPTREFRTPTPSACTSDILLRQGSPLPKGTHGKGRAFPSSSSTETISRIEFTNPPYTTKSPMHRILEIQRVNDSDFSDAETEVSNFGEALERCNTRGRSGRVPDSVNEERSIRDNDLYG